MAKRKKNQRSKKSTPSPKKGLWEVCADREVLCVGLLIGFALVVRIIALMSLEGTLYFKYLLPDEDYYHNWAVRIAEGTYNSTAVYENSPLMAYLIAGLYKVFGPETTVVRIFNVLVGLGTCVFIYMIARDRYGIKQAVVAALIAALCAPLIIYSVVPLKTCFSVFLFAGVVWFLLRAIGTCGMHWMFLLGLFSGFLINMRPNTIVLLPLVVLFPLAKHLWGMRAPVKTILLAGFLLVGLVVSTGPFIYRNYSVAGKATLMTAQAGFNFYIANDLHFDSPFYHPARFATTSTTRQGAHFTVEASRRLDKKLTPEEASDYWLDFTLNKMLENPGKALGRLGEKILGVMGSTVPSYHYKRTFLSRYAPYFSTLVVGFVLVFPFAMFGLVRSSFKDPAVVALLSMAVLYGATLAIFHVTARYRAHLFPILIPFAAHGIFEFVEIVRVIKSRQARAVIVAAVTFGLSIVVLFIPLKGKDDFTSHLNQRAVLCMQDEKPQEAIALWKASVEANDVHSDFARQSLANVMAGSGKVAEAKRLMKGLGETTYVNSERWELHGDIHYQKGQIALAEEAYRKSIDANFGREAPRVKLVNMLIRTNGEGALTAKEELQYIRTFYGQQ